MSIFTSALLVGIRKVTIVKYQTLCTMYTADDAVSFASGGSGSSSLHPLSDTPKFSEKTLTVAPIQQQSLFPAGCNNITFSEGFYCIESSNDSHASCNPSCYSWNQYSRSTNIAVDFMVLMSACIGVVTGIGVVIVAIMRRKHV